jgi:hypothetical protein
MKTLAAIIGAIGFVCAFGLSAASVTAQTSSTTHKSTTVSSTTHASKHKTPPAHPKNEITKVEKARKEDNTVRQVTPDPKKSPGKHADNLSKNVNHEVNRQSKDINHFFQGKKK